MKKVVLLVLVLAIVLGVLFWGYSTGLLKKEKEEEKLITLNYWGLWEDEATLRPVIEEYQITHPNTRISYNKQTLLNYRTRLQTQLRENQGPDIFVIHNSWISMFSEDLSVAPSSLMSLSEYSQAFYPLARQILIANGKIYGVPIEMDGLGMYVNEDILRGVGAKAPTSWQEFIEISKKVTVKNQEGQIQTAGAALGTTSNVDFWPEILSLLFFQQPNGDLEKPANQDGIEVLQFYTSFITDPRNKTWDVNLPPSTTMFSQGKLAFYFAPSRQAQIFTTSNPGLHFKVVSVPQLPGKNVGVGSFWAAAVSERSKYQKEAWEFLKFLTSAENLQKLSESSLAAQGYRKLYPRTDMAGFLSDDPILSTFILQAPFYKNWYLNSNTGDLGLNDEMIGVYGEVVNNTLAGKDIRQSLQSAQGKIKEILDKYTKPVIQPTIK